jgi:two-component system sensor histidine kinase/response regulator
MRVDKPHKILVIDDDRVNLGLLADVLKEYRVRTASSGEEALALIPVFGPDLILLDINMPGMGGYKTCRIIRADENYNLIKILFISGNTSLEERLKGYEVGADDYVVKPFNVEELRAKVAVFMKLKRIEEIDAAKSNLLSLFTHETRTPLSVIIGLTELLIMDDTKSDETQKCAQAIHKNAMDLHRFVEKATLLSRLKSDYSLQMGEGSVRRQLGMVIGRHKTAADAKGVSIALTGPDDVDLTADWELLNEVFGYILENAIQYSREEDTVNIQFGADERLCTVSIADRGVGIADSWMANIFSEFAVRDLQHHNCGQGLSLAIARYVVELHHGVLEAESRVGVGTTFHMRLPLFEPEAIMES